MDAPESHDGCFFGDGQQQPTNWELGECIGRGNFTKVHLVRDIRNLKDINCVVKHAVISDDINKKYLAQVDVEIRTLKGLNHIRIVEYHGFSRTNRQLSLFTPYMAMGTVATYMKSKQEEHLSEQETVRFTLQILEGLEYLHRERIIHRDIKGSNILMVDDQNIKIADFGVAKILNTLSSATTKGVGTVNWMAPELFLEVEHTAAVDIWSLGCTVYQMLTGTYPFDKMASVLIIGNAIAKKHELSVPDNWPEGFKRFLRLACKQDPKERPTAKDLLNFNFWSESDADTDADTDTSPGTKMSDEFQVNVLFPNRPGILLKTLSLKKKCRVVKQELLADECLPDYVRYKMLANDEATKVEMEDDKALRTYTPELTNGFISFELRP